MWSTENVSFCLGSRVDSKAVRKQRPSRCLKSPDFRFWCSFMLSVVIRRRQIYIGRPFPVPDLRYCFPSSGRLCLLCIICLFCTASYFPVFGIFPLCFSSVWSLDLEVSLSAGRGISHFCNVPQPVRRTAHNIPDKAVPANVETAFLTAFLFFFNQRFGSPDCVLAVWDPWTDRNRF